MKKKAKEYTLKRVTEDSYEIYTSEGQNYLVDTAIPYCSCKGFYYGRRKIRNVKSCKHLVWVRGIIERKV